MTLRPSARQRQQAPTTRLEFLSLRLLMPLALLALIVLGQLYTYETVLEQDRLEIITDLHRDQAILASRLKVSMADALREGKLDDIRQQLATLGNAPEIRLALLENGQGKVIAAMQSSMTGKDAADIDAEATLPVPPGGRTWLSPGRNLVLSAYPVLSIPAAGVSKQLSPPTHILFIVSDPAPMLAERAELTQAWMKKTSWVAAALFLFAWLLMHFLVSRRIGKLMQAVVEFEHGVTGAFSGVSGNDEIGRLGNTFDAMVRAHKHSSMKMLKLLQAVEQSASSVIITDLRGVIEYVNPAFTTITGYTQEEALGMKTSMLSAGKTPPEVYKEMWDTIAAGGTWRGEMLNRRKNSELYWDSITISPVRDEREEITSFVAIQEDITERHAAEEKLMLNAHILNSVNEGVAVTDAQQRFCFINPAFTAITGYTAEEVIGKSPKLLSSGLMERTFYGKMWGNISDSGRWQGEIIDRRKNGESYPEWLSISVLKDAQGTITHFISVFADISERKAVERRITHMAQHDFLTGLPNRMLLLDRMAQAISHAQRDGRRVALMFLDLDKFKYINDMLGHVIGDKLLQEVAGRISRNSRSVDTVCRLGGDEFVLMLTNMENADDVSGIAAKLLESVAGTCLIDGHEIEITTSIGIALFPDDGKDGSELLRHADAAMYHAKQNGRNNYHFFTSEMNRRALERMVIEKKLRHALERGEFALHYQPQIDLSTGRMVGAEALVRWADPENGEMIPPARFIPIAEENGMIAPIGEWVLREACRQMAEWRKMGMREIPVSVNLSAVQFRQKGLGENVRAILHQYGISPSNLELEITETAVMQDAEAAIALLKEMKDMGVRLAMDDFGTGYSSLSYLKQLPIDKLKIDQSFVRDIAHDPDDAAIVSTIISMARNLKLKVVAEGVETNGQLTFLNQHGCDEGQGYYFAKPVPHDEFSVYFKRQFLV
jgi:diguanylate cyclase (GGDEF)-like protein/PAS domain S-box-containing protein